MTNQGPDKLFDYQPEGPDSVLEEIAGAENNDRSVLPEDERTPVINRGQVEAREMRDDYNRWKVRAKVYNEADELHFTGAEEKFMRYRGQPLWQTGLFGALAIALIVGQWYLPEINLAFGQPLGVDAGGYVGTIRFLMMLAGAYCAFVAWPKYGNRKATDAGDKKLAAAKEDFRNKFQR